MVSPVRFGELVRAWVMVAPAVVLVGAVAYLIALQTFFSVLMPLQSGRPAAA